MQMALEIPPSRQLSISRQDYLLLVSSYLASFGAAIQRTELEDAVAGLFVTAPPAVMAALNAEWVRSALYISRCFFGIYQTEQLEENILGRRKSSSND